MYLTPLLRVGSYICCYIDDVSKAVVSQLLVLMVLLNVPLWVNHNMNAPEPILYGVDGRDCLFWHWLMLIKNSFWFSQSVGQCYTLTTSSLDIDIKMITKIDILVIMYISKYTTDKVCLELIIAVWLSENEITIHWGFLFCMVSRSLSEYVI